MKITPEILIALLLGATGAASAIWTLINGIRDRDKQLEKQEGEIVIDKKTQEHIAAEAAKINSDQRIETERWWKEQFDSVKKQLEDEKEWRVTVSKHIRQHIPWDSMVYRKLLQLDPASDIPEPPNIDIDMISLLLGKDEHE